MYTVVRQQRTRATKKDATCMAGKTRPLQNRKALPNVERCGRVGTSPSLSGSNCDEVLLRNTDNSESGMDIETYFRELQAMSSM